MGNSQGYSLVQKYYRDVAVKGINLRASQDNRRAHEFFRAYSASGSESFLTKDEALRYIDDLLRVSGLRKQVRKEYAASGKVSCHNHLD